MTKPSTHGSGVDSHVFSTGMAASIPFPAGNSAIATGWNTTMVNKIPFVSADAVVYVNCLAVNP